MNATELLANTLSPDAHTRQDATDKLESASRENYPAYMVMLTNELANESSPAHVRTAAGLALKNALSARESARQTEYSNRWLGLDGTTRNQVKELTLKTLGSPSVKVGQVAAQFTAAIAAIEFPVAQWLNVIEILLGFMNQGTTELRVATLQAIGFICESIKPELLASRSNEILTAVIHGARKEEPSPDVQYAAIVALNNSLEFVRANFEREGERNYIMQVVCEATQNPTVQVQVGAFEALVRIMTLYYEKMGFYMERALFGLTVMGMKHQDDAIALQAIEFWSTVAETEAELNWEAAEAQEYGEVPEIESQNFAKTALPEILPVILNLLLKQDEDADEDEWNVSMAAGTCLGLLATAVCDPIVQGVVPFIEANIRGQDWHQREAAVMAFGSIIDGPTSESILPLVNQALPILIEMLKDSDTHVKDTTAWTLGRICDLATEAISPEVLHPVVGGLVGSLGDAPRIIANSCWALMTLVERMDESAEDPSSPSKMAPYYDGIVQALLKVTETASQEGSYRTAAYEALTKYMTHAGPEAIEIVNNTAINVVFRMEQLLSMHNQILGVDDRNNWNDLQSSLCAVLVSIVRKLGKSIQPIADRVMTLMLGLMQVAGKTSTILEDAFLVVGSVASALERDFAPYVEAFLPYLQLAIKAHEDPQLCTVAVGVIGDISRALSEQTSQYAQGFMTVLFENLSSEVLNRNVKITILACFGDIAIAIGPAFEPYLQTTMSVLGQAGLMVPNPLDIELVEYVVQLREGILEAFTGIISAFKDSTEKSSLLVPYVQTILDIAQRAISDQEKTDSIGRLVFGIIGDLASAFPGGQIKQLLLVDWVAAELRSKRYPSQTRAVQRWAREQCKRATA